LPVRGKDLAEILSEVLGFVAEHRHSCHSLHRLFGSRAAQQPR
jgi:hypothetical protein